MSMVTLVITTKLLLSHDPLTTIHNYHAQPTYLRNYWVLWNLRVGKSHAQTLPILPVLDFAQRAGNLVVSSFGALGVRIWD